MSQSVVDVRAQLPVRLPIQHAEENALQASLCDVKLLGWGKERRKSQSSCISLRCVDATEKFPSASSRLTYCAVSCPFCQAHGVLAHLCSFSLSELSQAGHGGAAQQQMGAGQVDLRRTGQRALRWRRNTAAVVLPRSVRGLTQRQGTRLDRLTWRGANMCSCWRQEMAAACTSESEWSCIMAQPTRQDERMVEIVAPFPASQWCVLKGGASGTLTSFIGWQKMFLRVLGCFTSSKMLFCHLLAKRRPAQLLSNGSHRREMDTNRAAVHDFVFTL